MDAMDRNGEVAQEKETEPRHVAYMKACMETILREAEHLGVKIGVRQVPRDPRYPAMRDHVHELTVWPAWYIVGNTEAKPDTATIAVINDWMFIGEPFLGKFSVLFGKIKDHPRIADVLDNSDGGFGRTTAVQHVTIRDGRIFVKTRNTLYELVDPYADWHDHDRRRFTGLIPDHMVNR